jgi:D-beta-D-heptose 7-phosphate kinase/D-beta-D-heptose 1-phosphate adenosyltransferase
MRNKKRVLIIGDMMIDHYIYGDCNRISPEAPVPVVEFKNEKFTLGGAGNVLKNMIALGGDVDILSVVGQDSDAHFVTSELTKIGVTTDGVLKDNSRCTTIKTRILSANHQLIRLDKECTKPIDKTIVDKIITILKSTINQYSIVLLSDYNKGLLSEKLLEGIISICNATNVPTLVDPKGLDFSKYYGVTLIKPNKKEAVLATGITINSLESLKLACIKIQSITNCKQVVITMSEEGMAFYNENVLQVIPTKAIEVIDVSGAGDTVLASLGFALASNVSLKEACQFSNKAAAVVVSKVGSATATFHEINDKFPNDINNK